MLQRVVLGQVRFNMPGLVADARGVVVGRQLVARFAAIDRLVVVPARAVRRAEHRRSAARAAHRLRARRRRDARGDRAHADRVAGAGGRRRARRPAGGRADVHGDREAVRPVPGCARAVRLRRHRAFRHRGRSDPVRQRADGSLSHRDRAAAGEAAAAAFAGAGRSPRARAGCSRTDRFTWRHAVGSGPCWPGTCTAAASTGERRPGGGGRAVRDSSTASAFAASESFWLFRVERLPARMHGLLTRTPGLDVFVPVTDNVAVAAGYRHPDSSRIVPGQLPRRSAAPVLARRGHRGVAASGAGRDRGHRPRANPRSPDAPRWRPRAGPIWRWPLRLQPSGRSTGPTVAALVPWNRVPWLQRLCYALPTSALRTYRVAPLERGVLVRANDMLRGDSVRDAVRARRP